MLKGIPKIISPELLKYLCEMGHSDRLVITDGNFPTHSVGKNAHIIRMDGHGVCKILDYQKYLYQQKKKAKEMKLNSAKIVIKEIRFGPNTDEHDFQFKLKHAQEFLNEGAKVKSSVFFRGRSIQFAEQGEKLLLRFAVELEEFGRAEHMPVLEGKRMNMMIAPVKKK